MLAVTEKRKACRQNVTDWHAAGWFAPCRWYDGQPLLGGTDLVDARTLAAAFSSDDGHDLQRSSKGLSQACRHHCAHVSIPMDMQPKNQGQDLPNVVTSAGTNPHIPFVSMMAWSCASNALASSTDSPSAVPRHAAPTQSNSSLLVRIRGRGKVEQEVRRKISKYSPLFSPSASVLANEPRHAGGSDA